MHQTIHGDREYYGFLPTFSANQGSPAGTEPLPHFLPEQLGQPANGIGLSGEVRINQGQCSEAAVATQSFTQPGTDRTSQTFQSPAMITADSHDSARNIGEIDASKKEVRRARKRETDRGYRKRQKQEKQALADDNKKLQSEIKEKEQLIKANLEVSEAESRRLEHTIEEKEQQLNSNRQSFEAENGRLKCEIGRLKHTIEEKDQLMQSSMEVSEAEMVRLKHEVEEKEQQIKSNKVAFEAEIGRLKREFEEKEQAMKSKLVAFEAENGKLKFEIREKERLKKSNLEALKAEIEGLKHGIEVKEQQMKVNLEASLAETGQLKHDIQAKEQLMKANWEASGAEIRQFRNEIQARDESTKAEIRRLNNIIDSLKSNSVPSNQSMQRELAQLRNKFDKFELMQQMTERERGMRYMKAQKRRRQRYENQLRLGAGCIPFKIEEEVENQNANIESRVRVLMISTPTDDNLVFPKGGWRDYETVYEAACREVLEEAGVKGIISDLPLGVWEFRSKKHFGGCRYYMFALEVTKELDSWFEQDSFKRKWLTTEEAFKFCRHDWLRDALRKFLAVLSTNKMNVRP